MKTVSETDIERFRTRAQIHQHSASCKRLCRLDLQAASHIFALMLMP